MKKKVICIVLALLMSLLVTIPSSADDSSIIQPNRALISASFGLKNVSGSTYKMWARINNPEEVSVFARLTLYDASYNCVASVYKTSSNPTISLNKSIVLASGTYHLQLSYTADGATYSVERTYTI